MSNSMGGGGDGRCHYVIVVKPINCECTSILNNIILLRTL